MNIDMLKTVRNCAIEKKFNFLKVRFLRLTDHGSHFGFGVSY